MGSRCPATSCPVRSYLIIYRPEAEPIQIVRVLDGYRDIAELLS